MKLELATATALAGAGVFSIHAVYTQHAGSLSDVRSASSNELGHAQKLIDADALAGGMTLIAGGAIALATKRIYPLILAVVAFGFVAWYYHAALAGPSIDMGDSANDYGHGCTDCG